MVLFNFAKITPISTFRNSALCLYYAWSPKILGSYIPELIKIGRERGISGLYSGLLPTLVRAFPANAALFLGVETGKKFFDKFVWP